MLVSCLPGPDVTPTATVQDTQPCSCVCPTCVAAPAALAAETITGTPTSMPTEAAKTSTLVATATPVSTLTPRSTSTLAATRTRRPSTPTWTPIPKVAASPTQVVPASQDKCNLSYYPPGGGAPVKVAGNGEWYRQNGRMTSGQRRRLIGIDDPNKQIDVGGDSAGILSALGAYEAKLVTKYDCTGKPPTCWTYDILVSTGCFFGVTDKK